MLKARASPRQSRSSDKIVGSCPVNEVERLGLGLGFTKDRRTQTSKRAAVTPPKKRNPSVNNEEALLRSEGFAIGETWKLECCEEDTILSTLRDDLFDFI